MVRSLAHSKVINMYKDFLNLMNMPANNYYINFEYGSIIAHLSKHEKTKKHICFVQGHNLITYCIGMS